jgi:uncharacterized repeat protein (TIGR01451 family)
MRTRLFVAAALAALATLAFAGPAAADVTLGTTTQPAGSSTDSCNSPENTFIETASDPSTPFTVPTGGGFITSWSTNTTGASAGATARLVVVRPAGGSNYTVQAVDTETLPTPLPASNVATFNLASPIPVNAGDTIGIEGASVSSTCFWSGGSTPLGDTLGRYSTSSPSPPAVGQTLQPFGNASGFVINLSAVVTRRLDAGVTTGSAPAKPTVGNLALLSSTVTNNGPAASPITFTDQVPGGMTVDSALAGGGPCSVSGQLVTCTITLAVGQSAPVDVVVTPTAVGSYANNVSVAPPSNLSDPNSADNAASATIAVGPSVPAQCVVPKLKGIPAGFAKTVLTELGCRVSVRHKHSRAHKGLVTGTSPGRGTYAYQTSVTVKVSSGKKKHKHHK